MTPHDGIGRAEKASACPFFYTVAVLFPAFARFCGHAIFSESSQSSNFIL